MIIPPRFACDVMLGRTARWLRMLGFDTFYDNQAGDEELRKLCQAEERVLLTKDMALHGSMPAGTSRQVEAVPTREQLREIVGAFQLGGFNLPPRCSLCNGALAAIGSEQAKDAVPAYVFRTQSSFQRCRQCHKTYWPGSHLAAITLFLKDISQRGDGHDR